MRYRLRTLSLLTAIGPPILAIGYWAVTLWMGTNDWRFLVAACGYAISYLCLRDLLPA